jgi:two-component system, NtrC family, sensor kinase
MNLSFSKETTTGRIITAGVCIAVFALISAGVLVGVWTAQEMSAVVTDQFNTQQMVIAQTIRARIEREIGGVKREIFSMSQALQGRPADGPQVRDILQQALPRLTDNGVRSVEIVDLRTRQALVYTPPGRLSDRRVPENGPYDRLEFSATDNGPALWISLAQTDSAAREILFAAPLTPDQTRLLVFHLSLSMLLPNLMKNIQSGKTGYAWLIDQDGTFLYHPNAEFVGHNAFLVRDEKFPALSYARINFIQKEKMLQGEQGTGWFYSAWHLGITGPMKKLIAYCPIPISSNPRQLWSVAVVAPESEVEDALRRGSTKLFLLLGLVVLAVALGAGAIIWLENRWSKVLETRVLSKTEALAKSEEKYRSLVESAEDFIFTMDREGRFQSLNTFTANFFGGPPEIFIGKPISNAFPAPQVERLAALIARVHSSGKSIREEFELPLEAQSIWISANLMPIKTETGEVGTILCIARDITETKNLQRQLVNAEKLASLGTLAAGVAHEINNPLGVILGFCELLLRKTDPNSQQHEDLKTIERQGLLCKETVENLLSFARAEKQQMDHAELNGCIREIVKVVRHLLEKKGIRLALQLADELPPVKADARQLQQVFLNLITNAMAAMENGGALTIRSLLERNPRRVVVQFQDTGVGVSAANMDRIFEPFFTTKPEGQGTGLGLFVSYGIITSYGGTLDCTSTPATTLGKQSGTTFTVKLLTGSREDPAKT